MSVARQAGIPTSPLPTPSFVKRFDTPERAIAFGDGRVDVITIAGRPLGKGSFPPGWQWTPAATIKAKALAGVVLSGRAKVKTKGGESADLAPGDFFSMSMDDECWVVGLRPCEILYVDGLDGLI